MHMKALPQLPRLEPYVCEEACPGPGDPPNAPLIPGPWVNSLHLHKNQVEIRIPGMI
jgi:hypothetical protein